MKKIKKATIILSHGSKNEKSNKQFKRLVSKSHNKNRYIKGAFLEYGKPRFEKVVREILSNNITDITIFPLFLFGGYHVREDIPEKIIKLKNKHQELNFTLMEPLGLREDFSDFLKSQLNYNQYRSKII
ncbi:MAG TPA: CbiX/SirB N-terminal domain-containing protein [Halanaerobiales bacterium]|nr:CbiX/SirB N-terminal domain-containing protein [Halanaerobiales bacterium]